MSKQVSALPHNMSEPVARRIIREASKDSARVFITKHATQRMRERYITRGQVLECLRRGTIIEPPHRDIHGGWKCNVTWRHAGDHVTVSVGLKRDAKTGDYLIVITVFGE